MKKQYKTPYLIVESFQLDTSVASCSSEGGMLLSFNIDKQCGLKEEDPDFVFFNSGCEINVYQEIGQEGNPCYNAAIAGAVFINS